MTENRKALQRGLELERARKTGWGIELPSFAPPSLAYLSARGTCSKRVIYPALDSDQCFTPRGIRDLAWTVLGSIDLDPATSRRNPMHAAQRFTSRGLERDWIGPWVGLDGRSPLGSIWLNPPYGRAIGLWLAKLSATSLAHPALRCLALVPARPGTKWWARCTDPASPEGCQVFCELGGRLTFEDATGAPMQAPARWASALLYYGPDRARVARALRSSGIVRYVRKQSGVAPRARSESRQLSLIS